MEVKVYDEKKIVAIWLTKAEQTDEMLQQELNRIYVAYSRKNYKIVQFHSGTENLYSNIRDLLIYSRKRVAELEVQREKCLQNQRFSLDILTLFRYNVDTKI